jgi:hypothetical protein
LTFERNFCVLHCLGVPGASLGFWCLGGQHVLSCLLMRNDHVVKWVWGKELATRIKTGVG